MAATNFTPISIYYSATASATPSAGNLVAGELAINTNDGKLFYKDSSGVVQTLASKATTSGTFTSITDSGLTSGRVTYATTGGLLTDSANLVWDNANTRLGISTSSPQAPLSVSNSGAAGFEFYPTAPGGGTGTYIQSYNRSGSAYVDTYYYATSHTWRTTASSTSMVLNSSGNVGIGTSSPTQKFVVSNAGTTGFEFNPTTGNFFTFNRNTVAYSDMVITSNNTIFQTGGATETMRIDSSGNLLLNTTTSPTYAIQTGTTKNGSPNVRWEYGPSIVNASYYVMPAGGGSGVYINSGNTSWSSNSDARLKNVIGTYTNALADIAQLEPVKFTWKSDASNKPQVGVIAQSVQKVVPEAVDVDALSGVIGDEEKYLSVRYTELIPLLIASIQEQQALIESLTQRIATLENK